MGSDQRFRLHIEPRELIDRVHFASEARAIRETLRDASAVVSTIDINRMQKGKEIGDISLEIKKMPNADLESLVRSVPNKKGELVYASSMISSGYISHDSLLNYQTFIYVPKLLSLDQLSALFERFSFSGVHNSAAYIISYKDGHESYVAFYVPPLIETIPKGSVSISLNELSARARSAPELSVGTYNGDRRINMENIVDAWNRIMANRAVMSVQVVRDGTHRLYLTHACGAPQYVVSINGVSGNAPSVPIPTQTMVMVDSKPDRKADRYLGLNEEGWTDEKFVGIDG